MTLIGKATWPSIVALSLLIFLGLAGSGTRTASADFGDPGDICATHLSGNFGGSVINDEGDFIAHVMREESFVLVWAQLLGPDVDGNDFTVELDNETADASIVAVLDNGVFDLISNTNEVNFVGPSDASEVSALKLTQFLLDGDDFFNEFDDDGNSTCDDLDDDAIVLAVVECEEDGAGVFDVSFSDEEEGGDSAAIEIECRGDSDDDNTTFDVNPASIEIIPAVGNVAHSFARLILEDADGNPASPGQEVLFTVDKCGIEESEVDSEGSEDGSFDSDFDLVGFAEWEGAEELFRDRYGPNRPIIARAIENSEYALATPDTTEQEDNSETFTIVGGNSNDTERTVAGAIVHCDIGHTQESTPTPGVVTVTAIVEQDGTDDIFTAKITLVGPPASITINASPAELRCGEKAQIVVIVKDPIGQNVSDHTQIEAVTNAGGVLGGTGAVIGFAGPVVPISSTVAETFGGTTTFYLLTSEQHSGPYEVVVTTGGANVTAAHNLSGLFSSSPLSVQTTVRCSIPVVAAAPAAPVPTVTAPRTGDLGTGSIRPPSTGDAGLASSDSNSWMLVAVAGVALFSLAGLATVKVTRR